ncbi:hypothetical protein N480_13635 [Pseudoalteromonas luteoviolacea S2607]|uniref:hypothetical protein n=1 Tax=Pseudoalteromonas luteoviolacea TaxID=43657 RepID=UPI0007B09520|nr:hypothetical protein [Pseudoalteromonas luteoviolacea]KZN38691.1 hypothetical protein N480_13635 [Pseudoalteromonas luteoviolacea S2607]
MSTNYKIYLVNQSASGKNMWCFLSEPEGLTGKEVYANSTTSLYVEPNYAGLNYFTVPVQYSLQAGASNKAVGLDIKIDSNISIDADLKQSYDADYATAPPKKGPNLSRDQSGSSPDGTLRFVTNSFDKVKNQNQNWFESATFGIETADGFIGSTWAPDPDEQTTITPKFKFYVSTGSFKSGTLADFNTISNSSAVINLSDFERLEVTVTLTSQGTFIVTPGKPAQLSTAIKGAELMDSYSKLINSHNQLVNAHSELIYSHHRALSYLMENDQISESPAHESGVKDVVVKSKGITFNKPQGDKLDKSNELITGTITVGAIVAVGFLYMIASGINLRITNRGTGGTKFDFSYNGDKGRDAIESAFKAGKDIKFSQHREQLNTLDPVEKVFKSLEV